METIFAFLVVFLILAVVVAFAFYINRRAFPADVQGWVNIAIGVLGLLALVAIAMNFLPGLR